MTKTQANESGFVLDAEALEAAAKASYEYEGDRRDIDYLGWSDEPENVRRQWLQSVRLPVETYCAASAAPIVPEPAYGVKEALEPFAKIAEHDIGADEADTDFFQPMVRYNRAPRLTVGDVRRARAAFEALSPVAVEEADAKAEDRRRLRPGDIEPHNDVERTVRVVRNAYAWTVDGDGRVAGLVAGDMGYESTHIVIDLDELRDALWLKSAPSTPSPQIGKAGAGPVGEAVAAWQIGEKGAVYRTEVEAWAHVNGWRNSEIAGSYTCPDPRPLYAARPVEEPDEIERLTRERDEARRDYAELDKATEAALAETRERLEKLLAAAGKARTALAGFTSADDAAFALDVAIGEVADWKRSAALTGDAQEAGR